ncbi:polysulfide reductase NrfD [bacterium]|nr:polysulfide reductase NrfD [bacterium]
MDGVGIPKYWPFALAFAVSFVLVLFGSIGYLVFKGTGIWGLQTPNAWGWAIINFVFWVGIGHAGTLISAILFLTRQNWRTSINRSAEAMTIFAVICALVFPTIHVGRVWFLHWTMPIPNQMNMWPNFRSPLMWDVFAVSVYFTVSLMFWFVGFIPDFATIRDRSTNIIKKRIFGVLALGWRFSHRHWQNYEKAYLILAGIATPLVLSVHSVVSFDFAVSQVPGWHTTIFPPYFVAGAIFSGFGMVLTLMILARKLLGLKSFITMGHLDKICKILLATGLMVGYAYTIEFFVAWYSGNEYESFIFQQRAFGHYAWAYWIMFSCNVFVPQIFWFKKVRQSIPIMFVASILVNVGMWFERFVIVISSLSQDFLPSSWGFFKPTIWDISTFAGTFGLFFTSILLFIRFLPVVAMAEVKGTLPDSQPHHHDEHEQHKNHPEEV